MSTPAQIAANQSNAQQSTGPKADNERTGRLVAVVRDSTGNPFLA